jgi:hypothetical protein
MGSALFEGEGRIPSPFTSLQQILADCEEAQRRLWRSQRRVSSQRGGFGQEGINNLPPLCSYVNCYLLCSFETC